MLPPPADRFEVNDDAGRAAHTIFGSKGHQLEATVDAFDDPRDVYRINFRSGRTATMKLDGPAGKKLTLVLWRPGTAHVTPITAIAVRGPVVAYRAREIRSSPSAFGAAVGTSSRSGHPRAAAARTGS